MPFLILSINKGYKTVNRYLAGYLFFSALYLLGNFYFFYGESLQVISIFLNFHPFFFLIGPLSFFYVRSVIRDDSKLSKADLLHFALFFISLAGLIPFIFSSSDYRLLVAAEMKSETWDMAKFEINKIIPHLADQVICLLQTIFYAVHQWILVLTQHRRWKKGMLQLPQYKLIHKWLLTFISIYAVVAINYFVVVVCIWLYDDKSEFLARANIFLLFASLIFMAVNLSVLAFPQILYGLPQEKIAEIKYEFIQEPEILENEKQVSQLFSEDYILKIKEQLQFSIDKELYLNAEFKITTVVSLSGIPAHHLSYYFNSVLNISFSEWRNNLRIDYVLELLDKGESKRKTLESLALQSGFMNQNTFIRAFKSRAGVTPSQYVKGVPA